MVQAGLFPFTKEGVEEIATGAVVTQAEEFYFTLVRPIGWLLLSVQQIFAFSLSSTAQQGAGTPL
jgi:hypothetical protein